MKPWLAILFLIFGINASAQTLDNVTIIGKLLSAKDSLPVSQAHIVNVSINKGTVSNQTGDFKITVQKGQILVISSIEYQLDTIFTQNLLPENHLNIYLTPQVYQLNTVYVYPFSNNKAEFKQHFLSLNLDKKHNDVKIDVPKNRKMGEIQAPSTGFGIAITSPITWLYNIFSKEAKEKREYIRLLNQDAYKAKLAVKYNKEIVAKLTGITNEQELDKFMEFCDLPDPFIEHNQIYDILEAVQICFTDYQKQNQP